jgi:hypothetical protein
MHQHKCNNICLALGLMLTQQKILFPMFECSHNYIIKSIHVISKECNFRVLHSSNNGKPWLCFYLCCLLIISCCTQGLPLIEVFQLHNRPNQSTTSLLPFQPYVVVHRLIRWTRMAP